jgi:hypothetical protein
MIADKKRLFSGVPPTWGIVTHLREFFNRICVSSREKESYTNSFTYVSAFYCSPSGVRCGLIPHVGVPKVRFQ